MSDPLHFLPAPDELPPGVSIAPITLEDTAAEDLAEAAAATERAEAFRTPIRAWNGHKLHGFSIGRESLWLDLRAAAGAPCFRRILGNEETSDLQPLFPDAVRLLYILIRSQEEVKSARQNLLQFEQDAGEWADLQIPRRRAAEAITEVLRIYNAAQVNEVELVTEGTGSATRGK